MINIQNFQQTDYTSAGTSTLSSDIKELKEKVRAIEAKIATDTDAFTQSPGIESIPDKKAVANACQEIPQQNVKGKGLLPGIKIAAASVTGFAAGFVIGKITEEAEKAIEESDKNNESSTRDNKENVTKSNESSIKDNKEHVTKNNEVKPDAYTEKNTEELSSGKVRGFNVKSGMMTDGNNSFFSDSYSHMKHIEEMIQEYAEEDEGFRDMHERLPGDVHIATSWDDEDSRDPVLTITRHIDIKFDPESNILESFNMTEKSYNPKNGRRKTLNTCSAIDEGDYIIYKWNNKECGCNAVKYNKTTHKTTTAGFMDLPLSI